MYLEHDAVGQGVAEVLELEVRARVGHEQPPPVA
jgi:hypothetical protein